MFFTSREQIDLKSPVFLLHKYIPISYLKSFVFSIICLFPEHNSICNMKNQPSLQHGFQTSHGFIGRRYRKAEELKYVALLSQNIFPVNHCLQFRDFKSQIKIFSLYDFSRLLSYKFI